MARLDAREVEDRVDQREQIFAVAFDDLDEALTAGFNAELKAKAPPECVRTDPDTGEMGIGASSE